MSKNDLSIMTVVVAMLLLFIGCAYVNSPKEDYSYEYRVEVLFNEAQHCPAMLEECKDPYYQNALINGTVCISCKALTLLYLREFAPGWDDTLGESEYAETLTEDAMAILEDAEE